MEYNIPLFDLNYDTKEEEAVIQTLRSKWISTGPKTAEFEIKFAEALNAKYSVALSNGTVALHLALKIAGITEDDEVICPSLTFVATVNAIRYLNAVPVFADIRSFEELTIDPSDIEKKITNKTKAILLMHYGGFSCDMSGIISLAEKYNLKVIEDTCHSPLAEFNGVKLGTIGDIGCFSFFSNKNISIGEGGMLVTNNQEFFDKAKLLRSHGMTSLSYERAKGHSTSYDVTCLGYNYRMDDIRASLGIVQLSKLQEDLRIRIKLREYYIEKLEPSKEIIIPFLNHKHLSSNYIFPIILKNSSFKKRDFVREKLKEKGIQTSVHYPAAHLFSIYRNSKHQLPLTEYASENLITLPLYSKLDEEKIDYIADQLKKII